MDLYCYEKLDIDSSASENEYEKLDIDSSSTSESEVELCDLTPIITTIKKYHQFFVASVAGELDLWVKKTFDADKKKFRQSRQTLALFSNALLHQISLTKTVNTALSENSVLNSKDAYRCFVDSILRANDKQDMEFYTFLDRNQHVAQVLQERLPKITRIAKRWYQEKVLPPPQLLATSMKEVFREQEENRMVKKERQHDALQMPLKKRKVNGGKSDEPAALTAKTVSYPAIKLR